MKHCRLREHIHPLTRTKQHCSSLERCANIARVAPGRGLFAVAHAQGLVRGLDGASAYGQGARGSAHSARVGERLGQLGRSEFLGAIRTRQASVLLVTQAVSMDFTHLFSSFLTYSAALVLNCSRLVLFCDLM